LSETIDELIRKSLDIEQQILNYPSLNKKDQAMRERLQKESDALWKRAKELGRDSVTQRNYEDLANAVIRLTFMDYEDIISGAIEQSASCNLDEIHRFAAEQTYTPLDLEALLAKVHRVYHEKFIPYAEKYASKIVKQWREFDRKRVSYEDRVQKSKYRCPLCGGCLKPKFGRYHYIIGCTGCDLETFVYVQKSVVPIDIMVGA